MNPQYRELLENLRREDEADEMFRKQEAARLKREEQLKKLQQKREIAEQNLLKLQIRMAKHLLETKTPINKIISITKLTEEAILKLK